MSTQPTRRARFLRPLVAASLLLLPASALRAVPASPPSREEAQPPASDGQTRPGRTRGHRGHGRRGHDGEILHGPGHGRHHGHDRRHSFADVEDYVERFESPERAEWQLPHEVVRFLRLQPGDVVADVGAGSGYFSVRFAREVGPGGVVFAADVEPGMVEWIRDRADAEGLRNVVPVLCSYDDPRLPPRSTDLVFFSNTWHHVEDRTEYARRLRGDLAPFGRLVIVDFHVRELPVGPPPAMKLTPEQVREEVEAAGYRLVRRLELPYQYLLELAPVLED